ncbi:hypothetical protein C8J57DRAFT_1400019 [Mycena rebaudengoi]|nr:hypothetical protein C8J57DRAFT_1400019 [Mycena rebaudengoi]
MASSLWVGVTTLWVSTFLYGIYLVLFCRCMYIFYRGKKQITLLVSAIIMFMLATADVAIFLMQGAVVYNGWAARLDHLQTAGAVVYVTNNLIADALLIYRCYVIWNTVWVTIVPILLLIATMILGYSIQLPNFFILSLSMNLFLPTLIAARLWWVVRRIRGSAGAVTRRKGRNAMIIILESGLIYSVFVSIHMGFFHYQDPRDAIVYAALGQIVGMVPTLIIVRVGLGVSEEGAACAGGTMVGSDMGSHAHMHRTKSARSMESGMTMNSDDKVQEKTVGWDAETIV